MNDALMIELAYVFGNAAVVFLFGLLAGATALLSFLKARAKRRGECLMCFLRLPCGIRARRVTDAWHIAATEFPRN